MRANEVKEIADRIIEVIANDRGRGWMESVRHAVAAVLADAPELRRRPGFATEPFQTLDERVTALEDAVRALATEAVDAQSHA